MGVRRDVDASAPTLASKPGHEPTVAMRKTPGAAPPPALDHTLTTDGGAPAQPPARAFATDWSERGRYALVTEIARGGGGRIAIAVDRKLGRKVALKRPLDRDGEERLEREALVLARLEHPAIVPIHDAGRDGEGNPYYTMKLLGGATLADRIAACASFDERLALLPAVSTVADAVAYAHSQRVIHRDLKPGNVLVGEFGEVALIDWGLGKVLGSDEGAATISGERDVISAELTGHGAVVGTPAYMAPEQAVGEDVDERADVYALGAMLYHVLAGDVPYGRSGTQETLLQLVEGPPPAIEAREPRVPPDLAAIVAKAMARAPADRYPTARELAADLHRYQTGKLVAAHRYTLRARAWRWARRHTAAIAAGLALAATGVAGVAIARSGAAPDLTCRDVDAPVRAAWNDDARAAGLRAFTATGLPYAAGAWRTAAAALDGRAERIASMRVEACRAARVIRSQTAEVMDLRMQCLDRRTAELASLAGAFAKADRVVFAQAVLARGGLGRVEDCADVARLRDLVPLPDEPTRRAEIQRVEAALDELATLDAAGEYDAIVGRAPALATRALATGYGPVYARALIRWAELLLERDGQTRARALLQLAAAVADRSGDDVARGRALGVLVRVEVDHTEDRAAAAPLIEAATAVADRTHDPVMTARLLVTRAHLAGDTEHVDDAIALARRAVEVAADGAPSELLHARYTLGEELALARRFDEATREIQGVIDQLVARYGTDLHPDVARALSILGAIAYQRDDNAEARALADRAYAIMTRVLPPYSLDALSERRHRALMEDEAAHYPEALAQLEGVLADCEAHLGPTHSMTITTLSDLGGVLARMHRFDDALARYREALARAITIDPTSSDVANLHSSIGGIYVQLDQPQRALPELEAALEVESARTGPDGFDAAYSRADLGRALLDSGDAARGAEELRRAIADLDREGTMVDRGMYRTALSQALWKLGKREEARSVAAAARALLDNSGARGGEAREELVEWEKEIRVR